MKKSEIIQSLASELAERFREQAGDLLENISKGLIDAVLRMDSLYEEGVKLLEHMSSGGQVRNELTGDMQKLEMTPGQQEAIHCVLAYARMAHIDFPKSLIVRERLADRPVTDLPIMLEDADLGVLFAAMKEEWNPNVSDLSFNGLLASIDSHFKEIPRQLSNLKPDQGAITQLSATIACLLVELLRKVDNYVRPGGDSPSASSDE